MERIKDYLLLEEELLQNQNRLKPQEEREEVLTEIYGFSNILFQQEERVQVEELRGTPMAVGNLEEIIDDNHAIVSTSVGPEYYVTILSFVDKDELEPGCTVLLHHKACSPLNCAKAFFCF